MSASNRSFSRNSPPAEKVLVYCLLSISVSSCVSTQHAFFININTEA
jgi:hypothetical protein